MEIQSARDVRVGRVSEWGPHGPDFRNPAPALSFWPRPSPVRAICWFHL